MRSRRTNPRFLDRSRPKELQIRREQEKARRLIRLAKRGGADLSKAKAEALYTALVRQKKRLEIQPYDDERSMQLSRQITHVLSRYVGPATRRSSSSSGRSPDRQPKGLASVMYTMAKNAEGGEVHVANPREKRAVADLERRGLVTVRRTNDRIAGMTEWYYRLPAASRSKERSRRKTKRRTVRTRRNR